MSATIQREVAKIIADVLQEEMGLDANHCLLGDQEWRIPADEKLFVVVYDKIATPFGATRFLDSTTGQETQQAATVHDVMIEIMSLRSNEARTRKEEVILALCSFSADRAAESAHIQIGRPQPPVDASSTEETVRLLKYVTHVNVTALHQKVKTSGARDYFDKFNGATQDGTAKAPEITEEA